MNMQEYAAIKPHIKVPFNGTDVIYRVSNPYTEGRVQTLFVKEPDTIEWISKMQEGDVLFDVGANVGMYTIWASVTRKVKVFAFEPESLNYAMLNQNIQANHCNAEAYCVAISDEEKFDKLYLSNFMQGTSCHSFGENVNFKNEARPTVHYAQGCFSTTLDRMTELLGIPDYIKIDVDGIEPKVVRGGKRTLRVVKSVLVELDSNNKEHMDVVELMKEKGFTYDEQQVLKARRTSGPFTGIGNWIFSK